MILESIKTVFKELKLNKLRTFLTMLGIIVGIFSITIIFALSNATKNFMNKTISSMATELISFTVVTDSNIESEFIENDLLDYSKTSNKVDKMSKSINFSYEEYDDILELKNSDREYYYSYNSATYLAIDENYFELNSSSIGEKDVLYGRLLSKKDIINKMPYIVIREDTANDIFGRKNVVGEKLVIDNNELEIIGVLEYSDEGLISYDMANIYVSYYYAKSYLNTLPVTMYYFSAIKNEYSKDIKNEVKDILHQYISSDKYSNYTISLDMVMSEVESIVSIVELVFVGIASLSLVVGGIGIMNIMLVSVSERIKETGIRMALGARNSDIVFQFLVEGIMLTIFSGIFGIIFAWLTTIGINFAVTEFTTYGFVLSIDFITMLKIILFCGVIGIIFGIYPAIKAGKLDPVDALKYE